MSLQERVGSVLRGCLFAFVFLMMIAIACEQAAAQTAAGRVARVSGPIDETNRVILHGNTHPLARPQYDQGAVPDSQPLHRMLLVLQRGAAQETALRSFLDQQQSKSSSSYHQWLTAQQFGQQFGPADTDVQAVTGWLASHGFEVARVSPGKTVVEFSGTAGQVRQAFQTEIHRYVVNGQEHFGNSSDPSIPAALAPVVAGPATLHNFPRKPQSHIVGTFRKNTVTGRVVSQPVASTALNSIRPLFNFSSSSCATTGGTCYALGPADWDTIYNVPGGITGSGQTIAIVGDSAICTKNSPEWQTQYVGPNGNNVTCNSDDVATFRSQFSLPAMSPACPTATNANNGNGGPICVILDGPDPGFNGDETEGDLDTEWAGAVARNATIDFVAAEDTETTFGTDLAAEYVVDNNLASVVSESFGECEAGLGNTGNQFEEDLWEEAAAQGITAIVSTADSGSAACDDPDTELTAEDGVLVNGIASTPFNVAAGGTDFDISASGYPNSYWNNSNNGTTGQSAKAYIPETSWNDSCAQNFTGSLTSCNGINDTSEFLNIVGGGGGQSNCVTNNGTDCTGGYSKPSWQSGPYVTGTPATDNLRDIPDISIFSADGLKSDSFYIICEADLNPSGLACNLSAPYFDFVGVGGTSSAAPTFAGTMALVNQHVGGSQGNANYMLYKLANNQSGTSCNSSTGPSSTCTFNDITRGNNSVPCIGGTQLLAGTCSATNSSTIGALETGGVIAWNAGTGFDLATGLGSFNVTNLVNNWATQLDTFASTSTTLDMCGPTACTVTGATSPITITHGQTVDVKIAVAPAPPSSTATAPENGALILTNSACTPNTASANLFTSNDYSVANGNFFSLSGGSVTGSTSYLAGGTYYVKAHYTGDSALAGSDSNCISVTVNPENTTTTLSIPVINPYTFENTGTPTETLVSTSSTNVEYGDVLFLRADVKGATSEQENATGTVTFKDTSTNSTIATVPLNTEGFAELQMGMNLAKFFTSQDALLAQYSSTSLGVGSHTITATYNGGSSSYNGSAASPSVSFSVTTALTTTCLNNQASPPACATNSSVTVPGGAVSIGMLVDSYNSSGTNPSGGSFGTPPTGTVTFTLASAVPPPPIFGPHKNLWILILGLAGMVGILVVQIARYSGRRPRLATAIATVVLVIVAAAAIGCGGSGSSTVGSGGGGGTTVGTATLTGTTDAAGYAASTATLNFTPTGSETITATYSGDTNYRTSSTTFTITVE